MSKNIFIAVFLLSAFPICAMYGDDASKRTFELRSQEFIEQSSEQLRAQLLANHSLLSIYNNLNATAGKLRRDLAANSRSRNHQLFGQLRLAQYRGLTDVGSDTYDAWRKEINQRYFRPFFAMMGQTGARTWEQKTAGDEWTLSFKLMENNANSFNPLIHELAAFDENLDGGEPMGAIKHVCLAFPKMEVFPTVDNVNIAAVKISYKGMEIATYLLAIDAGNSDDLKVRAKRALTNFTHENGGPFSGTLIIHCPELSLSLLTDGAKAAFFDFIQAAKAGASLKTLKRSLALFRWHRSHALEFCRGSAAIAEWLEQILADFAGYYVIRDAEWHDHGKDLCDNMAFSMPPEEFVVEYAKHTGLISKQSPKNEISVVKNPHGSLSTSYKPTHGGYPSAAR